MHLSLIAAVNPGPYTEPALLLIIVGLTILAFLTMAVVHQVGGRKAANTGTSSPGLEVAFWCTVALSVGGLAGISVIHIAQHI